jgi:hypothetical protein
MQKKILLAVIICLMITAANAQIKKGAFFLGGQLGFSTQNTKNDQSITFQSKNNVINFSPSFGKAIRENLVVGADVNFGYNKNETNNNTQKTIIWGIGFFARKYKELGKGFYLFGQSRAGVNFYTQDIYDKQQAANNTEGNGYTIQLAVYPGVSYSVSSKLQLEAGFNNLVYVQYDHTKQHILVPSDPISKTDAFSLGSSLSNFSGLTVGFRVLLN